MQTKEIIIPKSTVVVSGICIILVAILVYWQVSSTTTGISSTISSSNSQQASKVNEEFMKGFFVYSSTGERYKKVQQLMTKDGFQSVNPSGPDMADFKLKSAMKDLRTYTYQSASGFDYYNEMIVTTTFKEVDHSQKMLIKTSLINKDNTYLVDAVEVTPIGEIAN